MPDKKITTLLMEFSLAKRVLLGGSALMLLSLIMPWYSDIDTFKTGDTFLGITGPLYLIGASIFAICATTIALVILERKGRKYAFLDLKTSSFYMITGVASFYLLIIVNSIYFHPKFGVNITTKESSFGMFTAFIAASMITIGGYLSGRDKVENIKYFQEESPLETVNLANVEQQKRPESLKPIIEIAEKEVTKSAPQTYRMDL